MRCHQKLGDVTMLREKIQKLIESSQNAEEAAKLVCIMLDDSFDLNANGWFEEDDELEELFDNPSLEDKYMQLSNKVEQLLAATSTSD